jgi:predicted GNAT superfamily acetyltransferase
MTSAVAALDAAAETVDLAMRRSAVRIVELDTPQLARDGANLLQAVWHDDGYPVPANLLLTIQHAGGYLFGAYDEDNVLVGVSMGLLSREGLHSHITGVGEPVRRHGLGYALKQHQRLWALDHGLTTITWTCDPLVRRNVTFNLHALGATVAHYGEDHYGEMDDGVNKGDESDRFVFHWELLSARAVRASRERLPYVDAAKRPRAVVEGADGPAACDIAETARVVATPADIETLRISDPAAAKRWRYAVRDAVQPALHAGGRIVGLTAAGELVIDA